MKTDCRLILSHSNSSLLIAVTPLALGSESLVSLFPPASEVGSVMKAYEVKSEFIKEEKKYCKCIRGEDISDD